MTDSDKALVHIVDDDDAVRDGLALLCRSVALPCRTWADARSFLDAFDPAVPCCVVCDVRMPGMSGLALQKALQMRDAGVPLIFITGHGDVPMAVNAMREGAVDFFQKPFNEEYLLERVQTALAQDRARCLRRRRQAGVRARYARLTEREREVMAHLLAGSANKVIASDLAISPRTVELHRARVMQKMGVRTLTDLVRVANDAVLVERREAPR